MNKPSNLWFSAFSCGNDGQPWWSGTECQCSCPVGFSGELCQYSVCDETSCGVGAPTILNEETCECVCPDGYLGSVCELTPCSIDPCVNGNCIITTNSFICDCHVGFSGPTCVTSLCDPADENSIFDICGLNGICNIIADDAFECLCNEGEVYWFAKV